MLQVYDETSLKPIGIWARYASHVGKAGARFKPKSKPKVKSKDAVTLWYSYP